MVAKVGESQDDIEARKGALRQYASVLADFHDALSDTKLPTDLIGDITMAWWESVLAPAEAAWDDDE